MNVENWLHGMGMRQYADVFRANGIGTDVLADLTEADLEKLGLNLGDRKRLLKAIAALGAEPVPVSYTHLTLPTSDLV